MTANHGLKPKLQWVPVSQVFVDPTYQRSINSERSQALIKHIGANFSWAAFGAALLVKVGRNRYHALDGQHRTEGAKLAKVKAVPAVIVTAASVADQAKAFVGANLNRVSMTQFALHYAKLAAEDPDAVALDRICKECGLIIPRYPVPLANLKPGETLAIGSIAGMRKKYGNYLAKLAVSAVAKALAKRPGAIRAATLRAAGVVIAPAKAPVAVAEAVTAFLQRQKDGALEEAARKRQRENRCTEIVALAEIIMDALQRKPATGAPVGPTPARSVKPGQSWAFKDHSTQAQVAVDEAAKKPKPLDIRRDERPVGSPEECRRAITFLQAQGNTIAVLDKDLMRFNLNGQRQLGRKELLDLAAKLGGKSK